jgi:hypothetical protein
MIKAYPSEAFAMVLHKNTKLGSKCFKQMLQLIDPERCRGRITFHSKTRAYPSEAFEVNLLENIRLGLKCLREMH